LDEGDGGWPAKANVPSLADHWLVIHAVPGTFRLVVASDAPNIFVAEDSSGSG
jgi:hypothetical protein